MAKGELTDKKLEQLVNEIVGTYQQDVGINFIDATNLPVRDKILEVLDLLFEVLFPGYTGKRAVTKSNVNFVVIDVLCHIYTELSTQIEKALKYRCRLENCNTGGCRKLAEDATVHLLTQLPKIREMLKGDVKAAFDGDPAAKSFEEIVISYPCITAIAIHRIAHELYLKEVPLIPRIMSECAHARTGIDIHPYQGTTLGAMSFPKDERGRIIKGGKRHPTIEDDVTIYAEATILGDITIGKGSIVGGNVWIKESVPPGVTVMTPNAELVFKKHKS
ncbi:MAG: serine acetyltransferase [Sedimentisphaerales bacterium]